MILNLNFISSLSMNKEKNLLKNQSWQTTLCLYKLIIYISLLITLNANEARPSSFKFSDRCVFLILKLYIFFACNKYICQILLFNFGEIYFRIHSFVIVLFIVQICKWRQTIYSKFLNVAQFGKESV